MASIFGVKLDRDGNPLPPAAQAADSGIWGKSAWGVPLGPGGQPQGVPKPQNVWGDPIGPDGTPAPRKIWGVEIGPDGQPLKNANGVPLNQPAAASPPAYQAAPSDFGESSVTLGGNPNSVIGQPARDANAQLQLQAYGASQRGGPTANMGGVNMFATGAGSALGQANGTNLLGVRQGLDLSSLANGPGVAAQYGAANKLMGMSEMPAGPSVAEQQLRMGADDSMRQQMAMAAGARGGNVGLAMQLAGANQGQAMGQLNGQLALQRASEDMANRQFAANAAQAAGGMYGQALDSQGKALGGAANIFSGIAGNQVSQANTQGALANIYAGMSQAELQAAMQQRQLNDQTMIASEGMGNDILSGQRKAEQDQYANQTQFGIQRYGIDKGYNQALQLQKNQNDNDWGHQLLAGALTTAGAVGGTFIGGPAGTVAGGAAGNAAGRAINEALDDEPSDIRAKTAIAPAPEVSDTFRKLGEYSYEYRDPKLGQGRQFGPMAQELEETPAGATAVGQRPDGMKTIDTSRLALLNASETAKMRRELDALKGQASAIRGTETTYPAIAGNDYRAAVPGNIDLTHRPYVHNRDGSVSTVRSMGANIDGREVLMPTVSDDGRILSEGDAIDEYRRTGRHLGIYRNVADSNAAGQAIHEDQMREPPIATLTRQNEQDEATLAAIQRAQRTAMGAMRQPTAYPTPVAYGGY